MHDVWHGIRRLLRIPDFYPRYHATHLSAALSYRPAQKHWYISAFLAMWKEGCSGYFTFHNSAHLLWQP